MPTLIIFIKPTNLKGFFSTHTEYKLDLYIYSTIYKVCGLKFEMYINIGHTILLK